jgi:hypothetical protein
MSRRSPPSTGCRRSSIRRPPPSLLPRSVGGPCLLASEGMKAVPLVPTLAVIRTPHPVSFAGNIVAVLFSTPRWEPSFYQGLARPLLSSALRGGIAFQWGLRTDRPGPVKTRILSPETISFPATAPACSGRFTTDSSRQEARYAALWNLLGLYTSSDRHIDKTTDAIWRASVNLARFGFVPPSRSCL